MIIKYSRKIRWNEIGAPILNYKQKLENLESKSRHMETVRRDLCPRSSRATSGWRWILGKDIICPKKMRIWNLTMCESNAWCRVLEKLRCLVQNCVLVCNAFLMLGCFSNTSLLCHTISQHSTSVWVSHWTMETLITCVFL